jgi:hypothetical protein
VITRAGDKCKPVTGVHYTHALNKLVRQFSLFLLLRLLQGLLSNLTGLAMDAQQ